MFENRLRKLWGRGHATVNGWLSIPSSFSAEIMAAAGFDSLTIDLQHGVVDYAEAVRMLQAMGASGVTPMARAPWLDAGAIMKILDAGAHGVICPMINCRADAERLVSYCRYPPAGARSYGPTRANVAIGPDYAKTANDEVLCVAMIETAQAMDNLDEIVATPGLDGVYIGPADLALGVTNGEMAPAMDHEDEELVGAIKRILQAAKGAGIHAGIHCASPSYAARMIDWGFDFVSISSDARLLAAAAGDVVARIRDPGVQSGGGGESKSGY